MLTRELQATLNLAADEALRRRHEYLTLEHLLLAILSDRIGSDCISNCGGNIDQLRTRLETFLEENLDALPDDHDQLPEQTVAFERVLQRAALNAQASGRDKIDAGNILAAIFQESASHARYLLEQQGITKLDLLNYISHGITKVGGKSTATDLESGQSDQPGQPGQQGQQGQPGQPGQEEDEDDPHPVARSARSFCSQSGGTRGQRENRSADWSRERAATNDSGACAAAKEQSDIPR